MTFEQAAFNTVDDYLGGAKALGPVVGINGSVLAHKVSLTDSANQLTVPQARKIMRVTNDFRMLHGLAEDLDHQCIQVAAAAPACVHTSMAQLAKEFGEYLAVVSSAWLDGGITPNELRKIDRELSEMVAAANNVRGLCAVGLKGVEDNGQASR
jgi:hypothetical protein